MASDDHELTASDLPPPDGPVPAFDPTPASPDEDPVEPRPYLEITLAEAPVDPVAASRSMAMIDTLLRDHTQAGLWRKLRGTTVTPVVEFLLVTDGHPDPTIRYLIGSNISDLTEDLDGILRTGLPNSYELTPTEWHPAFIYDPPPHPRDSIQPDGPYVAGVEFRGRGQRKWDWQTPLAPIGAFTDPKAAPTNPGDTRRVPLAALVEALRDAGCPAVFQVVVHPHDDWTNLADMYLKALEEGRVSFGDTVVEFLFPRDREERQRYDPPPPDLDRIEGIASRDPRHTLCVSARAAVLTDRHPERADTVARRLSTVLSPLSGPYHELTSHVATDADLYDGRGPPPGSAVYADLRDRAVYPATYTRLGDRLRRRPHESKGLVVAPAELAGFCILDGAGLAPSGRRAVGVRPTERTGLQPPPATQLDRYRPPGMALGRPLTPDRQPAYEALYLPPADQDRHVIAVGPTGAGKSVLTETAMLTNVAATDGPAILFDAKGGGTASEYLKAHYAAYGSLEDVIYFDCTRVLPALSVLDIRPLLEAGVPREEARSRIAGQYEEMLAGVMGGERYWQAVEAPKAVRNHLRALFDPVNGADAVPHAELFEALLRTLRDDAPPPVGDDRLADYFTSLLDRDRDVFNRVLGGAVNRVETIATDGRLAPLFDHVPDPDAGGAHFDFGDIIDEDQVVIFDFGGMDDGTKRTLTLALLSTLWRALQARAHEHDDAREPPLVNCYIEEAGAIADSAILDTLLSQGRSFGLSMFLGVQFLGQLDSPDPRSRSHEEALNETATILAGQVAVRDDLVDALASDDLPPTDLNRRLSRMPRGEWLIRPATGFGAESVRPFLLESLPPPPGHPESDDPLDRADTAAFDSAFDAVRTRSAEAAGLVHDEHTSPVESSDDGDDDAEAPTLRVDTAYAHTKRLPAAIKYDEARHALRCRDCNAQYAPTIDGLRDAVECHGSLDAVDRDDVPIGQLHVKRSREERRASDLSDRQFLFLQAVHNAQQGRYDPLEYDLPHDSMLRLHEYVGIDAAAVHDLIEEGLLRKDGDHPHRLYSVTPAGRDAIGEGFREGVDYGHGKGDLGESSLHRLGVILGVRYLRQEYERAPDSPVVDVQDYYDIDEQRRLDVAGLDADGEIVVTLEVERINHDWREAIPADFDKMGACDPDEAVWLTVTRADAHRILEALNDPLDGSPRVDKTYGATTAPQDFLIDTPGLTAVYTLQYIRRALRAA